MVVDVGALDSTDAAAQDTLDDDLVVWLSRVIAQDVNIFDGAGLHASSERNLFASGLLPTRTPGEIVFTLKGMAANDLVLVKTNNGDFNSAGIKGTSAETLSPESLEMFGAVRDGTLSEWLISHPAYVSKEK